MWNKYFGWARVLPIGVGLMTGILGGIREYIVLFAASPDPLWQGRLFGACLWVSCFIAFIIAWLQKQGELRAEKRKWEYPNIKGDTLKLLIDPGAGRALWEMFWYISVKVHIQNDSPAETNISDSYLVVNTASASFTVLKMRTDDLYFQPDPHSLFGEPETLWDIGQRERDRLLVRGRGEYW